MIQGLFQLIDVYCCNFSQHKDPIKLDVVQNGYNGYFYACPKYYNFDSKIGEKRCSNRISPIEYEKMLYHISDLIEEGDRNNEVIDLTGYKWSQRGISFEIVKYSRDKIVVHMLNKKQIAY
jgi:hypothetical protein